MLSALRQNSGSVTLPFAPVHSLIHLATLNSLRAKSCDWTLLGHKFVRIDDQTPTKGIETRPAELA